MDLGRLKRRLIGSKKPAGDPPPPDPVAADPVVVSAGEAAGSGGGGVDWGADGDDEEDDDFITSEVKRRLKELRKGSFMVLIPEEGCADEEEAGDGEEDEGSSSREWMGSEIGADGANTWCGFDALHRKYCERMLFFDKIAWQMLKEAESMDSSKKSPRSTLKLASALRNLSFKKRDEQHEDPEKLCFQNQQPQKEIHPMEALEAAYVAQLSLSWEVLHCQYMHLRLLVSSQAENATTYNCAAQTFQQFQVLLQRYIENEPFEQGSRVEIYSRVRYSLSKLLQVPTFQVSDPKGNVEDEMEKPIFASDLMKIVEECILTFRLFLKNDKKKTGTFLGSHVQSESSLQHVQTSIDKKEAKVKELFKKRKGWKSKSWPATFDEIDLLFAYIDIKVVSRALRMARLSKEQLLWCEQKMGKLDLVDNKLRRDAAPILFPC